MESRLRAGDRRAIVPRSAPNRARVRAGQLLLSEAGTAHGVADAVEPSSQSAS